MEYKGFWIYACQERCERYLINKDGTVGRWFGDCHFHDDSTTLYEIVNDSHGTTVGIKDSLEEAKQHVDELLVGAGVVG